MQVIQVTVTETPHAPRVGRMNRRGRGGPAIAKTKPMNAARAVRRVLTNRPIPQGQQALLRALYEAGDAGLTTSALTAELGRDEQQLNRLLGAGGAPHPPHPERVGAATARHHVAI